MDAARGLRARHLGNVGLVNRLYMEGMAMGFLRFGTLATGALQ